MWVQNVLLFSNQPLSVALWSDHWLGEISLTLEAGIALYVQMFFLYRLWVRCCCHCYSYAYLFR
jgi:hypothetical protein